MRGAVLAMLAGYAAFAAGAAVGTGAFVDGRMGVPADGDARGGSEVVLERKQGFAIRPGAARTRELADEKRDEGERKDQADGEGEQYNVHGAECVNDYLAP
jgi:hypothetical protein